MHMNMYDPEVVRPMREELTRIGFQEMTTPEDVDRLFGQAAREGTTLLVVNSVCGCSAGSARPAVALSLMDESQPRPENLLTVFAGHHAEATARARAYMADVPPSSPSIFLVKDGTLVHAVHRHDIQGRGPQEIAVELLSVFREYCGPAQSPDA